MVGQHPPARQHPEAGSAGAGSGLETTPAFRTWKDEVGRRSLHTHNNVMNSPAHKTW